MFGEVVQRSEVSGLVDLEGTYQSREDRLVSYPPKLRRITSHPHLIDVRLLLRKAQLRQTFVLHAHQDLILEQFIHDRVLERRTRRILRMQPMYRIRIEDFRRKVRCRVIRGTLAVRRRRDMAHLHPFEEGRLRRGVRGRGTFASDNHRCCRAFELEEGSECGKECV